MKIKFFIIAALTLSASMVSAQSVEEIMRISSSSSGLSTSRVMSMSGAFTSLGADAGSIDINPAGLGMYKSNDGSITFGTNTVSTTTNSMYENITISNKRNITKFSLGNISSIFYLPLSDKGLKNLTFGISYNESADFTMESFSESAPSQGSISDYFSKQLEGINPRDIDNGGELSYSVYSNNPIDLWGAIMNFNNLMIKESASVPYTYRINPDNLDITDRVIPQQTINRRGGNENFSFSMGTNIDEWLYLGMSMGAKFFYYTQSTIYQEWKHEDNIGSFDELYYSRSLTMEGSAFDFKVGATIQPITGLRIGFAYHAPKVTFIKEQYYEYQDVTYLNDYGRKIQETPYAENDYNVTSSQKILTGASYRLGSLGIISFDFVKNLNSSIKFKNSYGASDLTNEIQGAIKDNNEYKIGLEITPYRGVFIRGGFNYVESFYNYEDGNPNKYGDIKTFSAGLGYKGSSFYADLSYQNSRTLIEPYYYYGMDGLLPESVIDGKIVNNIVTMTLGVRF